MNSESNQSPNSGAVRPEAMRPVTGPSGASGDSRSAQTVEDERAWQLLGHATPVPVSHGFAARIAALAARTPQDTLPSRWFLVARLGLPLAAAAALLLSVASNLLLPGPGQAPSLGGNAPVAASSESGDLSNLARMEAALLLLPEDAAALDATALELASVDDPTTLTDDQLFGLVY